MTDELENQDSLQPDENLDSNQETEGEDLDAKLSKAEEIARNQRIRAEKAEQELKALKKTPPKVEEKETPKNEGLSAKDVIALRDVHEEDVDYLLDEAKLRGKSVSELKKDPYMKIILQTREEERASALATNTKTAKSKTKDSGDLLDRIQKRDETLTDEEMLEAAKADITRRKTK